MLSDEERMAVEHLKNYPINWLIENVNESAIKIILNLIEKQSKEIEELKEDNQNLEEYCQEDNLFEKDGDFKEFCDDHIADTKAVIEELKNKDKEIEYWKEQAEGYSGLAEQIKEEFGQSLLEEE